MTQTRSTKTKILAAAAAAVFSLVPMSAAQEKPETTVPVQRVTLFTSGVGMFTHAGRVDGDAAATLRFPAEQIDDILKSLTLADLDGGRIGTVTYPSSDPLGKTLGSFRIDLRGNASMQNLLAQLRGVEVTVGLPGEEVTGTVVSIETLKRPVQPDTDPVDVAQVTLFTGSSLRAVRLDDVRGVEIVDEALRQELTRALAAVAEASDSDKKPVTLEFAGDGERRVQFGYVVEAPVWKSSYRLVLGEPGKADLQGWAIVENQTDFDWDGVQLSLVSGRPISFRMPLYDPLYLPRPEVQVERFASLMPQKYTPGVARRERQMMQRAAQLGEADMEAVAGAAPAPGSADFNAHAEGWSFGGGGGVAAAASAGEVGALFEFTVPGVDLPRQSSAMIPVVVEPVEAERVSIYDANALAEFPLFGAIVTNTTDKHLPAGPVTVFDAGSYNGDAQVDDLPPGADRLISYGVDQQVRVDSSDASQNSITAAKIVGGVLELTFRDVREQTYRIDNTDDEARVMVIEHPRLGGYELIETAEPTESTERAHRFKLDAAAGEVTEFVVTQARVRGQRVALLTQDPGTLLNYARSGGINDEVRDALREVARRKQELTTIERQIAEREQQIETISREQDRIRQNMKSVDRNGDYYNRLLKKLGEQETNIETLQGEIEDRRESLDAKRGELERAVKSFSAG